MFNYVEQDPSAPKRNPSAFLLFSLTKRKELKASNPSLKNTEISRILGDLWRKTSDDEKKPFIEQEEVEREKYKERMAEWRENKAKVDKEKKERQAEDTARAIAEKKIIAEKLMSGDHSYKNSENDEIQAQRIDSFPPPPLPPPQQQQSSYRQGSPLNHSYSNPYGYEYGHQGYQDVSSHFGNMPSNRGNQHLQGEFNLPTPPSNGSSGHEKYSESFNDVFQNQHQFGFTDQGNYYDHGQSRQIKLEDGGADSPYSYNEEFDPVPIH